MNVDHFNCFIGLGMTGMDAWKKGEILSSFANLSLLSSAFKNGHDSVSDIPFWEKGLQNLSIYQLPQFQAKRMFEYQQTFQLLKKKYTL